MKRLPIERISTALRSACGGFSKLQYEQTGLSKLANHVAKKQPRFNGVCDLARCRKRNTISDGSHRGWGSLRRGRRIRHICRYLLLQIYLGRKLPGHYTDLDKKESVEKV
jgi:hypothetical protein